MNLQNLFRKIILQSKRPHFHSPCQCFSNNTIYSSFLWLISYKKKKRITISILYIPVFRFKLFFSSFYCQTSFSVRFLFRWKYCQSFAESNCACKWKWREIFCLSGFTSQNLILECIIWMYLEHFNISIFFSWSG